MVNVGRYTIHGCYGIWILLFICPRNWGCLMYPWRIRVAILHLPTFAIHTPYIGTTFGFELTSMAREEKKSSEVNLRSGELSSKAETVSKMPSLKAGSDMALTAMEINDDRVSSMSSLSPCGSTKTSGLQNLVTSADLSLTHTTPRSVGSSRYARKSARLGETRPGPRRVNPKTVFRTRRMLSSQACPSPWTRW